MSMLVSIVIKKGSQNGEYMVINVEESNPVQY